MAGGEKLDLFNPLPWLWFYIPVNSNSKPSEAANETGLNRYRSQKNQLNILNGFLLRYTCFYKLQVYCIVAYKADFVFKENYTDILLKFCKDFFPILFIGSIFWTVLPLFQVLQAKIRTLREYFRRNVWLCIAKKIKFYLFYSTVYRNAVTL
jgi:hypothetical protein